MPELVWRGKKGAKFHVFWFSTRGLIGVPVDYENCRRATMLGF